MLNRKIKGLSIFKRLSLSYLTLSLIVIFMGIYTTWSLDQLNRISSSLSSVDSEVIRLVNNSRDKFISQAKFGRKYLVSRDKDFHDQYLQSKEIVYDQLRKIGPRLEGKKKESVFKSLLGNYQEYLTVCRNEFDYIRENTGALPYRLEEDKKQLFNKIISGLDQINELTKAEMKTKIDTSNSIASQALQLNILAIIAALCMTVLIAYLNARTINRPILSLLQGTRKIANKQFDETMDISSPPEIKDLADSFNYMSSRLKELDQMKEDLVSHVSHELRSPLTSIKEATNLLLEADGKQSHQNKHNLLSIIQEECESLIHKVNNILDLSRMESGMVDFHMEDSSMDALVQKSMSIIKPIADKKEIKLESHLEGNLPLVFIDFEKIQQVLINILDNAIKFSPKQGQIKISVYKQDRTEKNKYNKQMLEVCISDSGCGISENDLSEIFDKFRKLRGKGTGLGLSIAKNIIIAHGGDIWVKSEPDQGSSFFFTLPVSSC